MSEVFVRGGKRPIMSQMVTEATFSIGVCHRFADRTLEMAKKLCTSANKTVDAHTAAIFVPSVPR